MEHGAFLFLTFTVAWSIPSIFYNYVFVPNQNKHADFSGLDGCAIVLFQFPSRPSKEKHKFAVFLIFLFVGEEISEEDATIWDAEPCVPEQAVSPFRYISGSCFPDT